MLAIFSTVPAPVVDRTVLSRLPDDGVAIDIAAPPGSVDFDAARELGVRAIWARGLGKRAPITVGSSQWYGIRQRIEAAEAERGGG
jgi:dipicolinate synthase subunit A